MKNIEAARSHGWKPVEFLHGKHSIEELKSNLIDLGVPIQAL